MPLRIFFCISLMLFLAGCTTNIPSGDTLSSYFSAGEEAYKKKNYQDSIEQWKKLKEYGASSPQLSALADIKMADAQFDNQDYIEAAATYESFTKFHPKHDQAPYALYREALCYYMQIGGEDTDQTPVKSAINRLQNFLRDYPASEYAADAKEKLSECYTKEAEHEIYIGRFYYRFGEYKPAIKRLEECVAKYSNQPVTDEAYYYLEKAYFKTGEKERGKEAFNRMFIKFPTSKYIKEAESLMKSYQ
jgi:outer membrane protein assembly factor BamD